MKRRYSILAAARLLIVASTTSLFAPGWLVAQGDGTSGRSRLSLTVDVGFVVGGPSGGLYDQLEGAGFDGHRPECYSPTYDPYNWEPEQICAEPVYPKRSGPGNSIGLNARYVLSDMLSVGASYSRAGLGGAEGLNVDWDRRNATSWNSSSLLVVLFWTRRWLRVGAGPGFYRLENTRAVRMDVDSVDRFGLVAEFGLQSGTSGNVFIDAAVRLYVVPQKELEFPTTSPDDPILMLRPTWSHVTFSLGLGFRP